jgi:hypothetical protein
LQLIFNVAGVLLLIATAWLLDWIKEGQRAIVPMPEPERVPA